MLLSSCIFFVILRCFPLINSSMKSLVCRLAMPISFCISFLHIINRACVGPNIRIFTRSLGFGGVFLDVFLLFVAIGEPSYYLCTRSIVKYTTRGPQNPLLCIKIYIILYITAMGWGLWGIKSAVIGLKSPLLLYQNLPKYQQWPMPCQGKLYQLEKVIYLAARGASKSCLWR